MERLATYVNDPNTLKNPQAAERLIAKYHLAEKKKHFIVGELSKLLDLFSYSATTQKELIASYCGDLERLVIWFGPLTN